MLTVQTMEPYRSCQIRAASCLSADAEVIFLFVSSAALFHARSEDAMSRVMNLGNRFEEATAYSSVNVTSLELNKLCLIVWAKRISTKYGPTVLLTLRVSETSIVQVFLSKRYSEVLSDDDMDSINSKAVALHLLYKGACESSKSYLLAIESSIYFPRHEA